MIISQSDVFRGSTIKQIGSILSDMLKDQYGLLYVFIENNSTISQVTLQEQA